MELNGIRQYISANFYCVNTKITNQIVSNINAMNFLPNVAATSKLFQM